MRSGKVANDRDRSACRVADTFRAEATRRDFSVNYQRRHRKIGGMISIAAGSGAFALIVIEDQQLEFGTRGQPLENFEASGSGGAVDENCLGHSAVSASSGR